MQDEQISPSNCQTLYLFRGLKWVQSLMPSRWSQVSTTYGSLKAACLKTGPTVGPVGRTCVPRAGEGISFQLPGAHFSLKDLLEQTIYRYIMSTCAPITQLRHLIDFTYSETFTPHTHFNIFKFIGSVYDHPRLGGTCYIFVLVRKVLT